jgi:hypothetical protein
VKDNNNEPDTTDEARVLALTPEPQDDEPVEPTLPGEDNSDLDPDEQGKAVHA